MSSEMDFATLDKKVDVMAARMAAGFTHIGQQLESLTAAVSQGHGRLREDLSKHVTDDALELREQRAAINKLEEKVTVLQTKVNVLWPIVGAQGLVLGGAAAKYAGLVGG